MAGLLRVRSEISQQARVRPLHQGGEGERRGAIHTTGCGIFESWNCLPKRKINLPLQQMPIFGGILSAKEGTGDGRAVSL